MNKTVQKTRRKIRTRVKVQGTKEKPRLSVFRSNKYLYAQLIDDEKMKTLLGVSEKSLDKTSLKKTERAAEFGKLVAKLATAKKIKKIVFDRGSYAYHGRIKAFADAAREGGLEF